MRARFAISTLLALALGACSSPTPSSEARAPSRARRSEPEPSTTTEQPTARDIGASSESTYPAPARLVAIGDIHGDLAALRSALRLAGAIDDADRWIGGELWIVQTGDLLDRGDEEDEILALVSRLERDAAAAGGRFVALNGNHEIMNVQGDFRYVTPDGFADFADFAEHAGDPPRDPARARMPPEMRGRAAAFAPGGRYARELAARSTAVLVGATVLVHGGLIPRDAARGLDAINGAVRAFFLGEAPLASALTGEDSPVWHRGFARSGDPATCAELEASLGRLGARRMVVGHTVQETGITSACDERVWRIDVGLARHYGGPIEVLEITGDTVRPLRGVR
jgi:hypothetical protein